MGKEGKKSEAPPRFELGISCLLDRRFNQLSHGAAVSLEVGQQGRLRTAAAGSTSLPRHPFLLQLTSQRNRSDLVIIVIIIFNGQSLPIYFSCMIIPTLCVKKAAFELGFATEWAGGGWCGFGLARSLPATWNPAYIELQRHHCGNSFPAYHPLISHNN